MLEHLEVWFVTGSQELYGAATLRAGRDACAGGRRRPRRADGDPGARRAEGGRRDPGHDPARRARGERRGQLHRRDRVDAHVLAGEDVDRRARRAAEAVAPSAHAVQPRAAVGGDRHGLHEPQPVGARRPRVRVHRRRGCGSRRKTVVGHWSDPAVRERIGAWARAACGWHEAQRAAGRAVRRQHAPGRRHRGRQGRGADPPRLLGERLRRRRPRRRRCTRSPTPTSTRCVRRVRGRSTTSSRSCARGGARRESLRDAARIEAGLRSFLDAGGFRAFTDTFEDLARPAAAARDRRAAADGRRLRLRRRGRLEDRGARARS